MNHPGATPQEWSAFRSLGIEADLLPVASDQTLSISPSSRLTAIGKVPSTINRSNQIVGFSKWNEHHSSADELNRWQKDPRLGISISTRLVRAIDIDIDDPEKAQAVEDSVARCLGVALPCRMRENSGKRLLALQVDGEMRKQVITTPAGRIELLANGQQFVAAGTHPSGVRYVWRDGLPALIPKVSQADLEKCCSALSSMFGSPAPTLSNGGAEQADFLELNLEEPWLLDRHAEPVMAWQVLDLLEEALPYLSEDDAEDYDQWIGIGMALKCLHSACTPDERARLEDIWHEFSQKSGQYRPDQADEKWASFKPERTGCRRVFWLAHQNGWRADQLPPIELKDLNDANSMDILADMSNRNLRFIAEERCWLYWDGVMWQRDPNGRYAQMLALQVSNRYERYLNNLSMDGDLGDANIKNKSKALTQWLRNCRNRKGIEDLLKLASADARFLIGTAELDTAKHLLGVKNGVVDLKSGELRPAAREDYITVYSPYAFRPSVIANRWIQFISEITGVQELQTGAISPRPELADYLQRAIGYCLTAQVREHKMFVAYGEGANGKNVLFDTLHEVFPGVIRNVPPELLMDRGTNTDPERASPLTASLHGARMVVSSEAKVGQKMDVALIKRHTGGGVLTARKMRENTIEFEITHKLMLMTNHRPALDHLDEAIKGRLHIIPFDVRWNRPGSPDRRANLPDGDKELPDKLREEMEGILAWCVEGAVQYFSMGLEPPAEVVSATRQYLDEEDHLGRWLQLCEHCVDPAKGARAAELLGGFNAWLRDNGLGHGLSQNELSNQLQKRGVAKKRTNEGTRYALIPPTEFEAEF